MNLNNSYLSKFIFISACAYADGSFTPEQAVLAGFFRGYCCRQTKNELPKGMMAAVGLGKEKITDMLPEGVYVGCQNSSSSVTITGPPDCTTFFVNELQSKGIFAKIVKTNELAFHSKYVSKAGKYLYNSVKDVIKNPKPRSQKWVSTSVPPEQALEHWALHNSPEYHYNNFCNVVLFEQVFKQIPNNAIVIEIAPHGFLEAILKKELPSTVSYVNLVSRNSKNNEQFLLSALGRESIYMYIYIRRFLHVLIILDILFRLVY